MSKNVELRTAVREDMDLRARMLELRMESFTNSVKDGFPMDASYLASSVKEVQAAHSVQYILDQDWDDVAAVDVLLAHAAGADSLEGAHLYAKSAKTLLGHQM